MSEEYEKEISRLKTELATVHARCKLLAVDNGRLRMIVREGMNKTVPYDRHVSNDRFAI